MRQHLEVLRDHWLLRAGAPDLRPVVAYLALTVNSKPISVATASAIKLRAYLVHRNFTSTYQKVLHKQFRLAHKVSKPVQGTSAPGSKRPVPGATVWKGRGDELEARPYPHQEQALERLAEHFHQQEAAC